MQVNNSASDQHATSFGKKAYDHSLQALTESEIRLQFLDFEGFDRADRQNVMRGMDDDLDQDRLNDRSGSEVADSDETDDSDQYSNDEIELALLNPSNHNTAYNPDDSIQLYTEMFNILEGKRCWKLRNRIPKAINVEQWFQQDILENDRIFKAFFRMDKASFGNLVEEIKDHSVFHNESNFSQKDVRYQLAVFLYRLGGKAGGDTNLVSGVMLGLSEGTVSLYIRRVLVALIYH